MSSRVLKYIPFSAIKGMDDVKNALKCVAVDEKITGLLIKGPTGTAKSILVRSFADLLSDKKIVNVPLNVTDEQLFGGLDIEDAIKHGKITIKDGLLQRANGNILYLDNANLFDRKTLSSIMECVESRKVIVEREGLSAEYTCETTVIATMDPAEQIMPDNIADRFDICVQTYTADNEADRYYIANLDLEYESDPERIGNEFAEEDKFISDQIKTAKEKLGHVLLDRSDIYRISAVCSELNVQGNRGDIAVAKVSRALAALAGKDRISDDNIKDAAVMCLLHRRGIVTSAKSLLEDSDATIPSDRNIPEEEQDYRLPDEAEPKDDIFEPEEGIADNREEIGGGGIHDAGRVSEIIAATKDRLEDMDEAESVRLHKIAGKSNRRTNVTAEKKTGRYRGIKIPDARSKDPAFDATIRAAAPYQNLRDKGDLSVAIEVQDIRDKIRVRRDSCSFLFVVDVSGSLVDTGMINDIKNGVKAMLKDGYAQRDKVALMTFRSGEIKIAVPFTRTLHGILDILDNTVTGGGTPIGPALLMIREYLMSYIRKNPVERCYVIMFTDGEATNPAVRGKNASVELEKIASIMKIPNTEWIIVDPESDRKGVNHALKLARMLDGNYIRLDDISKL